MEVLNYGDKYYPKKFSNIENPPKTIYLKGDINLLNKVSISIVGSRHCSKYGEKISRKLAKEIVNLGIVTVSGMAIGVDTIIHDESLNNFGKTIAIIPSGFNNIYPKVNENLFNRIITNGGLIITEYEPDEIADSKKFIKRNRLVSALGECLIITEAAYRSGTSITARFAREQGKEVFCVPSGLDNKCGVGTNKMIKNGAKLFCGIADIFEDLDNDCIKKYKENYIKHKLDDKINKKIPSECKNIYNVINYTATSIDYIYNKTKESIGDISYKLTVLELGGFIEVIPRRFLHKNLV